VGRLRAPSSPQPPTRMVGTARSSRGPPDRRQNRSQVAGPLLLLHGRSPRQGAAAEPESQRARSPPRQLGSTGAAGQLWSHSQGASPSSRFRVAGMWERPPHHQRTRRVGNLKRIRDPRKLSGRPALPGPNRHPVAGGTLGRVLVVFSNRFGRRAAGEHHGPGRRPAQPRAGPASENLQTLARPA